MKFGTSGLRGLVVDLEGRASALYADAFARHLISIGAAKAGSPILVGRDFRASSSGISATCIGALKRAGLSPIDCGTIPTPALALYGRSLGAACLMVTGSHIPDDRNGIKFYRPDGEIDKHDEAGIVAIAAELNGQEIDFAAGTAPDGSAAAKTLFLARNDGLLPARALSGLKIGVYQHSTVARDLFVDILQNYGAHVVALGRSEHFIPVDTEAVSPETIGLLRGWTRQFGLDAIVSADGDGDRPLVSDENGEPLRGDLLGLVAAKFLGADTVVTPVTSNSGIDAAKLDVIRTQVGSPFVIAGMQMAASRPKSKIVGFEANGGTLTGSEFAVDGGVLAPLPTRDSFLPALAMLHLGATQRRPLSQIAAGFGLPFAASGRLENFAVEASMALMAYLRATDANLSDFLAPVGKISQASDIDGLRVTLSAGEIVHLRPSGNAPEMRCYVEAATEPAATALLLKGLDLIRSWAANNGF